MANNCIYSMRVVAKQKESIERLLKIMQYKDPEYYLYRVFSAEFADLGNCADPVYFEQDGDYVWSEIHGDVAWACDGWLGPKHEYHEKSKLGASYTNLYELCKVLNVGVEIWSEEPGQHFQEHYIVDHLGQRYLEQAEDYSMEDPDNTGFAGDYMNWNDSCDVYELPTGMVEEYNKGMNENG